MGGGSSTSTKQILQPIPVSMHEGMLSKFTHLELAVIYALYNDLSLCKGGNKEGVSVISFLKFTNIPGVFGHRLFDLFNYKKSEKLDFEQFIYGIGRLR